MTENWLYVYVPMMRCTLNNNVVHNRKYGACIICSLYSFTDRVIMFKNEMISFIVVGKGILGILKTFMMIGVEIQQVVRHPFVKYLYTNKYLCSRNEHIHNQGHYKEDRIQHH